MSTLSSDGTKTSYSVSVSAVDILFETKMSIFKHESSWQRVRYYLGVGIN